MAEEEVTRMYELLDALGEAIHATKLCFFFAPRPPKTTLWLTCIFKSICGE